MVIKHQGKKYDVEVDTTAPGEDLKLQLFSLTGVEPDRQKILVKGGQLKDDTDMSKLGLKPGQVIMMMGTPGEGGGAIVRPTEKVKFLEDMTEAEAAQQAGATPAGLVNLGNTCYLNSTLQALRSIPELNDALVKHKHATPSISPQLDLTNQLKGLFVDMARTQDGIAPLIFLNALRLAFPQFAERSKKGDGYAQQDAEEAWSQIVSQLRQKLHATAPAEGDSPHFIDKFMGGEFATSLECDDPAAREGGEQPTYASEPFLKLNCHIDNQTAHLRDGLVSGLSEKIEKRSEVLGRDVSYTKTSKISRLPKYLTVHFVRFFWKRDVQKKAKIMRKVTFPHELDAVEFCTDELKKALIPVRDKVREVRKDEEDVERARKRRKKNPKLDGEVPEEKPDAAKKNDKKTPAGAAAAAGDGDVEMTETYKTDAEWEAEKDAALLASKKELNALIDPDLRKDEGANQSGVYELRAVVTHQGASADSGHYTAYVKKTGPKDPVTGKVGEEDGKWWWFNDDKVSEVSSDKIDALAGGGESHSALILLYKAIPMPTAEGVME